jgi:hypothetical protein
MLHQPIKTIIVPIQEYGGMIEDEMHHLLIDALPGLYTPACKSVVGLNFGRGNIVEAPKVSMGISNDDGRIIMMLPVRNSFQHERSRGTIGVCLVKDFVNSLIDNSLNWVENKIRFQHILDAYLVDPRNAEQSQYCEERIRCILQDLTTDVCNFIGQDNWNIYHTSQIGYDLKISKLEDFRIHEYMRLKRERVI